MTDRIFLHILVSALLIPTSAKAAEFPDFSAMAGGGALKWIWHKETGAPVTTEERRYKVRLRRSFEIPAKEVPKRAELVIAADESAEVFVNGHALGSFSGWKPLSRKDIATLLLPGRNVIAVEATNLAPSPAGFLGMIELPGMQPVLFDANTKSAISTAGVDDWMAPAFDDSSWSPAALLAPADCGIWGRISGPADNPTLQTIPENFPVFAVPGFEKEMEQMRQILFGHYRMDLSILPSLRTGNVLSGLARSGLT